MKAIRSLLAVAAGTLIALGTAQASLTTFQQYTGNVGVSTDGWGSTSQSGTISADVPAGASVLAAYLYTSTFFNNSLSGIGGTLNGNAVTGWTNLGAATYFLTAARADVTSIIKPVIDGGSGGVYDFTVTEASSSQDGYALVVVYQLGTLPVSTVALVDGFSATTGDSTTISFSQPLDTSTPGFFAEMRLGIGFSCCDQRSNVTVNGTTITQNAGNFDDGASQSNGSLITMGGFDDPFSPLLPSYAADHERYNLVPYITNGDTSIAIRTLNPSNDDNIFLAVFAVLGEANVCENDCKVPEPGTLSLMGLALAALGLQRRRLVRRPH